jgi:hypothetical protein
MERTNLKKLYFALLLLGIILNIVSASNAYKDISESNSNLAATKDMKQEDILKLLNKLKAEDHLMKKMGQKPRKTKIKSVFRIFNINKLFNPAGLYKDKI